MKMLTITISKSIINIVPTLISVAFITLLERKVLGLVGLRLSPQKIMAYGILQPMTDALKLANKEINMLSNSSTIMFSFISMMFLSSALVLWNTNMTSTQIFSIKMNLMMILAIISLNSIMMIYIGWSAYSKFSLMGAMRCSAQTISYEAVVMMIILSIVWFTKSFSGQYLMCNAPSNLYMFPVLMILWLPTVLAEMNRSPYDFAEGESELVSGFNTEYGAKEFSMIFIAEYSNIIFMMSLTCMLFSKNMLVMTMTMIIWVLWIRSVLPRLRFDKLMNMAWKILIPMTTMILLMMMNKI